MPAMDKIHGDAAKHFWFHSIDLGGGVVTLGVKSIACVRNESEAYFGPVNLHGRTLIDIGAWNGAYSFEAKRRGAARVLATDHYVWNHPEFRGREAFDLALMSVGLDIEAMDIDVCDLSPAAVGVFDVVLFAGVFYHLRDPIPGLRRAADLARHVLIVETHLDLDHVARPAMAYYPGIELNNDGSNWWGPNTKMMMALLTDMGFSHIDVRKDRTRGVFHAWRDTVLRRSVPPPTLAQRWRSGRLPYFKSRVRSGIGAARRALGIT